MAWKPVEDFWTKKTHPDIIWAPPWARSWPECISNDLRATDRDSGGWVTKAAFGRVPACSGLPTAPAGGAGDGSASPVYALFERFPGPCEPLTCFSADPSFADWHKEPMIGSTDPPTTRVFVIVLPPGTAVVRQGRSHLNVISPRGCRARWVIYDGRLATLWTPDNGFRIRVQRYLGVLVFEPDSTCSANVNDNVDFTVGGGGVTVLYQDVKSGYNVDR